MNRIYAYYADTLVESFWCDECLLVTLAEEPLKNDELIEYNCQTNKPCCTARCKQDLKTDA